MNTIRLTFLLVACLLCSLAVAQHDHTDHGDGQDHSGHDHPHVVDHGEGGHHQLGCGLHGHHGGDFDPGATAFHHIADANIYSVGPFGIPLPCIVYAPGEGWDFFMSSKFHYDAHGTGTHAYNGYVLDGGSIKRVDDDNFPDGLVEGVEIGHDSEGHSAMCYQDKLYPLESKSTADFGLFGGGITGFYDFSITKNVVSMLAVFLIMFFVFRAVASRYKSNPDRAPSGLQGFLEPIFVFIQDEVAKPFLGEHYLKFIPFLMSLFFFILGLNLWGQIPFLGGSNVTGNLAFTAVLAIFAFIVVNINGNKHYWEHVFWMPGVPAWVKVILTPVEALGLFIKPITLALRLFANITAGHMVIIIFVSFIFIFGKSGTVPAGAYGSSIPTVLLTMFMMAIELLVAFIQAFVFTILTTSYLGAAIEDDHAHEGAH